MIRSFEINNFKTFENLALDGLGAFTLMGGRNNVGKTCWLEAAFLFCDQLNPELLLKPMSWRGLQVISGPDSVFASSFFRYRTTRPIRLTAIDETGSGGLEIILDSANNTRRIVFSENNPAPKNPPPSAPPPPGPAGVAFEPVLHLRYLHDNKLTNTADIVSRNGQLEIRFNTPPPRLNPTFYLQARTLGNPKIDADRYGELEILQQTDMVLDFVRVVDPRIKSLSSIHVGGAGLIHADIGWGRKIPINFLGEGAGRLLSIILAMAFARNGIVLVDELDNGLHDSVLAAVTAKLMAAADHFNCQLIATTHSEALLRGATQSLQDQTRPDFVYFHFAPGDNGPVARRYSFRDLPGLLAKGQGAGPPPTG
jgi:hypothetical protein